jgi:hypothetical protein
MSRPVETKYDLDAVRKALTKQKDRGVWNTAELLRLCKVADGNFYLFLKGDRGMLDANICKLLNIFQLDENSFRQKKYRSRR